MKNKEKTIYDLPLHEWMMVDYGVKVTRVAGGWIYNYADRYGVFVPYNNEFEQLAKEQAGNEK